MRLAALKGVFTDIVSEQVSYVNAPVLAEARGVETRLTTTSHAESYRNTVTVRAATAQGAQALDDLAASIGAYIPARSKAAIDVDTANAESLAT